MNHENGSNWSVRVDCKNSENPAFLLPPANEVCGKVIFLHVCVILSTGGPCMVAGVHAQLRGGTWMVGGGGGVGGWGVAFEENGWGV